MSDNRPRLGYDEKNDNLSIRIAAHKRFSNFSLEDWIDRHVELRAGSAILDIGCGNGNLFAAYSKKIGNTGLIVGVDKSRELLEEAKRVYHNTAVLLLQHDMNSKFPFIDESFDYCVSSFAIYYADNVSAVVEEMARVMNPSGEAILIGPTDNNAKELYDFNEKVFGFPRDEKIGRRTNRIENEFYPAFRNKFASFSMDRIPSKLSFPNKDEFLKYYMATLLFEESVKKSGAIFDNRNIEDIGHTVFEVSKEMVVLRGRKSV